MTLQGFPPLTAPHIDTLILGSMPGRDSLNASEYYAHGRNAFWPIMGELYGASPALPYEKRVDKLLTGSIGVWDVIHRCLRETSLDSMIDEASIVVNDFASFIDTHQKLKRIFFNGGKAEQTFNRYVRKNLDLYGITTTRLPSTSPANARMNLQKKLECWREALLS